MKKGIKQIIIDIISGISMGIASAIPGVSGGTLAVQLGVYDRHLEHMAQLRKKFLPNLVALLPLACGIIFGLVPAVLFLQKAFQGFVFGLVSLFAGFILGGVPGLLDEIKTEKFNKRYLLVFIITLLVAIGFGVLSGLSEQLHFGIDLYSEFNMVKDPTGSYVFNRNGHVSWWIYLTLIPVGMFACVALIVPGISGSMVLLVAGYYNPLLDTTTWIKDIFKGQATSGQIFSLIGLFLCLIIGCIIGFLTIVKLMSFLFNKFKVATYYGILGFVLGSVGALYYNNKIVQYYSNWSTKAFPTWFDFKVEIILAVVLFIVSFAGSYVLVVLSRKAKRDKIAN